MQKHHPQALSPPTMYPPSYLTTHPSALGEWTSLRSGHHPIGSGVARTPIGPGLKGGVDAPVLTQNPSPAMWSMQDKICAALVGSPAQPPP